MADLISWPDGAKVDRLIPKDRLYAEAGANTALKQRFVDEVQQVRWAYKLGEESLRLAPGKRVTEVQVFVIDLKGSELDNSVLSAIDRSVPSQIIFELVRADGLWTEQAMAAAHKPAGGKPKTADYFRTGWLDARAARATLPPALDMDGLYEQLLGRLLPHPLRASENLSDGLDRMKAIRSLGRDIVALEKRVRIEPQFNRKVELRSELLAKQAEHDQLVKDDDNRMIEDAAWRT